LTQELVQTREQLGKAQNDLAQRSDDLLQSQYECARLQAELHRTNELAETQKQLINMLEKEVDSKSHSEAKSHNVTKESSVSGIRHEQNTSSKKYDHRNVICLQIRQLRLRNNINNWQELYQQTLIMRKGFDAVSSWWQRKQETFGND
jgi:hypothetical protein